MTTTGDVEISIVDNNSSIVVPAASVQVVMGVSSSGTASQPVATKSAKTLQDLFGEGPGVEAAALSIGKGATVIFVKLPTVTLGTVRGTATKTVTAASNATPIVITSTAHGLTDGDVVTITGVTGNTAANGTFIVNVLTADTFELDGSAGTGVYVSGGSIAVTGVEFVGTGTSKITVTLDGTQGAFDSYFVVVKFIAGGTRGTAGIKFQISLDAGRTFGPTISLGTATTYAIGRTGITLNFSSGTFVTGDLAYFSTVEPAGDSAGVLAAITALQASPYAVTGWGSMHLVGVCSGSNATTYGGYLDTMATNKIFSRLLVSARDVSPADKWGGTAETEAVWQAAVEADFAAVSQRRICWSAGHYNMASAYPSSVAGVPKFRRPLQWAHAARLVQVPPQRHTGRVRDGALESINIDATNDPTDGFVYHDERLNPGFDDARGTSARTRIGLPGLFIVNPKLASQPGSDFSILPLGQVMDIACGIAHTQGQMSVNDDVRLNANGTIFENDAVAIEKRIKTAIDVAMTSQAMISSATVVVDRTNNVRTSSKVLIAITIGARGYILEEDIAIGLDNALAA